MDNNMVKLPGLTKPVRIVSHIPAGSGVHAQLSDEDGRWYFVAITKDGETVAAHG